MQKSYKNLMTNSFIFAVANFGSKIITFLMVPVYTYLLEPEAYGTIDIVTTTCSLLVPIVFMCIPDAVMRYTMDKKEKKEDILSNGLCIFFQGFLICTLVLSLLTKIFNIAQYKWFLGALLGTNGLLMIFNQFLRSVDKVKQYAINGVLYTFAFVTLNILFLLKMNMGVEGYFYSMIFANSICIFYAFFNAKAWKYIIIKPSKHTLGIMLKYSIPLIPNSLMWWIMDASDKYVIAWFLGANANGIYAIAKKIPTVIDTFHGIFNQAWQISAIKENESEEATEFTSNIYKMYTILLVIVVSFLMMIAKPIVKFLLAEDYRDSWRYIPLLLIAVVFSSLSVFLNGNFIAKEKTNIIFRTAIYGAVVNVVLNFALIPIWGINGATSATAFSYLIVLIMRERESIRQGNLIISFKRKYFVLFFAIQFVAYYFLELWQSIFIMAGLFLILLLCYRKIVFYVVKKIIGSIKRR